MAYWTPLRALLVDVASEVTLTWKDLDDLVGGLPRSAYEHSAFWKGARSGWPGFTTSAVHVGESVTFVRVGQSPPAAPTRSQHRVAPIGAPDFLLIGCVKQKLAVPAPAKDLYTSPLFRKGRRYAEEVGVPWFVLSAEHGLVDPDEPLAPYDRRLSKSDREYRRAWGMRVINQLVAAVGPLSGKAIEVHAGSAYVEPIREHIATAGATLVEPLAGLKLGPRLAWYGPDSLARATAPEPSAAIGPAPGVSELVARLTSDASALTPATFLATGGDGLRAPGLYAWWVDTTGAADLSRGFGITVEPGLIYAGLAGATRARSGRKSRNTLWGRIKTMDLGGRHEFSTFRLSLGSVLAEASGREEIDEAQLTAWMHEHLRLIPVPVEDADTLGSASRPRSSRSCASSSGKTQPAARRHLSSARAASRRKVAVPAPGRDRYQATATPVTRPRLQSRARRRTTTSNESRRSSGSPRTAHFRRFCARSPRWNWRPSPTAATCGRRTTESSGLGS